MIDRHVESILRARSHRERCAPPSEQQPLSLAEAYAIQDRVRETLVGRGERVIGWKAGFTSKAAQELFQCHEPVSAFLLASGVYPNRGEVPAARFVQLVVEAEIALVLKLDLAGPGITPLTALGAVEGAVPALELVDFRYSGKPIGSDVVADGVYANAIVLGSPLTDVRYLDLALEGLVYEHNGALIATNTAAEVMGSPLNSLAWVANDLGARGLGLKAGQVVMTGSVSALVRPKAGDSVRATYTRLGSVSARFV
jgi:2-oxopent-4-enoate/cis-2-oxohex-4-enoate hydratase